MIRVLILFFFSLLLFACQRIKNQAFFLQDEILVLDGKIDDKFWQDAHRLKLVKQLDNCKDLARDHFVLYKITDKALIFAAQIYREHIWANFSNPDDKLYEEEAFEIFLDIDGDGKDYYEIEINPLNTIFDLKFDIAPYKGGVANPNFNFEGIIHAVHIEGSLNDPTDNDKFWSVEISIPLQELDITEYSKAIMINANFAVIEWPMEYKNGRYYSSNLSFPHSATYVCWLCHYTYSMHIPDKWQALHY